MENQTQEQGNGQMPAAAPTAAPGEMATEKRDNDGAMIFLSYFGIFALIPYLTVKDSDFIRWHAKQGLTLFACSFIISFIPILGQIAWLVLFILDIVAMVKAFGGERWEIPGVSVLAKKW